MCIDFEPGSAQLDQVDRATLRGKARWMRQHPGVGIFIVGYSDETGNSAHDHAFGQARADAVRRYLVAQGANPHALRPVEAGQVGRSLASFGKSANALSRPIAALARSPRPASRPARGRGGARQGSTGNGGKGGGGRP
ncbi:MAG: OmpA family protein [Rhodobacteraceae bacterium]|nr:OmpA family protein [Paracoccaceae bacterium]